MQRYLLKQLKTLVLHGVATDLTNASSYDAVSEPLRQIGYSAGQYGCNGKIFKGERTNNIYVIAGRTQAIFIF